MTKAVSGLLAIVALAVTPWLLAAVYMDTHGVLATGRVVAKREAFVMPGGDSWKHVFEVTFEYRPADAPYADTAKQRVTPDLYRRLHVGGPVQVRYSPSRLLRSFAGMGLYLEDSPWMSRLHYGPPSQRDLIMLSAIAVLAAVGWLAWVRRSKLLGVVAAIGTGMWAPEIMLAATGLLLCPVLFWAAWRRPGKGYGWTLAAVIASSTAILYWRIPQPSPPPRAPIAQGTAVVQQVRIVHEIWSDYSEGGGHESNPGQDIRQPYQMVELAFTPSGAAEPIHFLDAIDADSVPALAPGASVPVEYSIDDPAAARIAGGTRHYAEQAFRYLLLLTYGFAAAITFVLIPAARAAGSLFRALLRRATSPYAAAMAALSGSAPDDPGSAAIAPGPSALRAALSHDDARRKAVATALSRCPPGDPRRKAIEAFFNGGR